MDSYAAHMFTAAVQAEQEALGLRERFQAAYRNRFTGDLDDSARSFIAASTSFYMATVSQSGWPYVQHRGGPAGFLKVLAGDMVGFADYAGNQQLISKGNLADDDRVSLFLMDYRRRARLKMIGHARMIPAASDPGLAARLATDGQGDVERLTTIRIAAIDWNCPKYITPRYTEAEIDVMLGRKFRDLAAENERLKGELAALKGTS